MLLSHKDDIYLWTMHKILWINSTNKIVSFFENLQRKSERATQNILTKENISCSKFLVYFVYSILKKHLSFNFFFYNFPVILKNTIESTKYFFFIKASIRNFLLFSTNFI